MKVSARYYLKELELLKKNINDSSKKKLGTLVNRIIKSVLSLDYYSVKANLSAELTSTGTQITYRLGDLLWIPQYEESLLKIFNAELLKKQAKPALCKNIINILMDNSEIKSVKEFLITILFGDKGLLKELMFDYGTVYPVPAISQTIEFRNAIVKYLNSKEYLSIFKRKIRSYNNSIPTQYMVCFNKIKYFDHKELQARGINSTYMLNKISREDRILSIKLLKNDKMKIELIKEYVRGWIPGNHEDRFLKLVNKEFPTLKLSKEFRILNIK